MISIITLNINNYELLKNFIDSIKKNTVNKYELIIVDNGSSDKKVIELIKNEADKYILNKENLGFAKGFNQALNIVENEFILMSNNDTEYPEQWDKILLEDWNFHPQTGLLFPCYTSGLEIGIRKKTGNMIIEIPKFTRPPSGVSILSTKKILTELGNWCEDYGLASGEDADLCCKCWEKNYKVVLTERVLVFHVGKQTAKMLDDWQKVWKQTGIQFREKWKGKINF